MIKINATILEEGLVEDLLELMENNKELFNDSQVALMPDAHKTGGIPVGFTMTVPHYRVAPDFISADVACGMTSYLIKNYVPLDNHLKGLAKVVRDLVQVDRRYDANTNRITDLGTLGGGNHFLEIGTNGKDTLVTVHSGSRNLGGNTFKKWKLLAEERYKKVSKDRTNKMLQEIEPKLRQAWLEENKLPKPGIHFVELDNEKSRKEFVADYTKAYNYALESRKFILNSVISYLRLEDIEKELINTTHNYIDFDEEVWVIRKGSVKAVSGEQVIIPINMRDGIIVGEVTDRGEYNNSLPHGAGRILSRGAAFDNLSLEQFKEDMKEVHSSTVVQATLDESPRAYKNIDTILEDIGDGLTDVKVFKSIFNYKGV